MKTSRRLDRSNHSLLSADNSIPEESEEEEEDEEVGDSEEKRVESVGKAVLINNSVKERRRCLVSNSSDEARRSQTSSEGWETQSETSCMEASGSVDAAEMEVSVDEKEVKGSVEQSEALEEVGSPNEEEEYRKDIEYLVGREDEESDEETQDDDDTSQQEEVETSPVEELLPQSVKVWKPVQAAEQAAVGVERVAGREEVLPSASALQAEEHRQEQAAERQRHASHLRPLLPS